MAKGLPSVVTKIETVYTSSAPQQVGREETHSTPLPPVALSKLAFTGLAGHSAREPHSHHWRSQKGWTNAAFELESP